MRFNFLSGALILTWLLTPESLGFISRAGGLSGYLVFLSIGVSSTVIAAASFILHSPKLVEAGYVNGYAVLIKTWGRSVGAAILLVGRLPLLFFGSTAMLVSAGFAFNEIFLYWFPNFLFASLLLVLIVFINICGEEWALRAQWGFIFLAMGSLFSLLGLAVFEGGQVVQLSISTTPADMVESTSLLLICFIGFDFYRSRGSNLLLYLLLMVGTVLLALWAVMVISYLDPVTLRNAAVSHMQLARAVGGEVGRQIMGLAVISGVAGGVNGLFVVSRRGLNHLSTEAQQEKKRRNRWLQVLFFGVVIETMMMTGSAGKEVLETQLSTAILLWLFSLGARILAAGKILSGKNRRYRLAVHVLTVVICSVMACLTVFAEMKFYSLGFSLLSFAVILLIVAVWQRLTSMCLTE